MQTPSSTAAGEQSIAAGPSAAVAQQMEELDTSMLEAAESQAQGAAQWLQVHSQSEPEQPPSVRAQSHLAHLSYNLQAPVSPDNYPGVLNIDNHEWSDAETKYLIASTLLGRSMDYISNFFANTDGFFSWPVSYCRQRITYLAATEVHLPRDWMVSNTILHPPYIPQLSPDEEAELRIFVETGHIYTDYIFRDYRTRHWLRLACHELYNQRVTEPELWKAKFDTAVEAADYRRRGLQDRMIQWRNETRERRERLEAAQRTPRFPGVVSDDEIAGEEAVCD